MHIERGTCDAHNQAFGLHLPGFYTAVRLAVLLRVHHAERPALPVFDGRLAVGIEQIALVQHGIGDFLHVLKAHEYTSSSLAWSRRAITSSHVGSPRAIL